MARASTYTLLSLDRYARIMGINPLHFNGGTTSSLNPRVFPDTGCNSIWFQWDYQHIDQVSREAVAEEIAGAEYDIMNLIGYPPAPMWINSEVLKYPRNAQIGSRGILDETVDVDGRPKAIKARFGKFIIQGQRALTLAGQPDTTAGTLDYTDNDGDNFYETATITITLPADMSSLTDTCEFKTFFSGETTEEWEIRYPRSASISGGVLTIVFDSWLFINPDLWEAYPTSDGARAIDVSTIGNFVTSVDVYREYADTTSASCKFYWENNDLAACMNCSSCNGSGCDVCTYTTQDGCMIARDVETSFVVPYPSTYNADDDKWYKSTYIKCVRPDMVKIWYKAGYQSRQYIAGNTCDPISNEWAQIISWIATARLERPLCECGNLSAVSERLREDLSTFSRGNVTHFQTDDIINCPFGTLRGEVMAWRRLKKTFSGKQLSVATI